MAADSMCYRKNPHSKIPCISIQRKRQATSVKCATMFFLSKYFVEITGSVSNGGETLKFPFMSKHEEYKKNSSLNLI